MKGTHVSSGVSPPQSSALFAAYCGLVTAHAGGVTANGPIVYVAHSDSAFTYTIGDPTVIVNKPGWYDITFRARSTNPVSGAVYQIVAGPTMNYADGNAPEDWRVGDASPVMLLQGTGPILFDEVNNTIALALVNSGLDDIVFNPYIEAFYISPP